MHRVFIIFVCVIFLSGCVPLPIPHAGWETAIHEGVIIDQQTEKPVSNVLVKYSDYPDPHSHSGQDGEFYLGPVKKLRWIYFGWFVATDMEVFDRMEFHHPQYKVEVFEDRIFGGPPGSVRLWKKRNHTIIMSKK